MRLLHTPIKQCTNFLFQSLLYATLKHKKKKKTSKKPNDEMKAKPKENLTWH